MYYRFEFESKHHREKRFFKDIWKGIKGAAKKVIGTVGNVVKGVVGGAGNVIKGMVGTAAGVLKGIPAIASTLSGALGMGTSILGKLAGGLLGGGGGGGGGGQAGGGAYKPIIVDIKVPDFTKEYGKLDGELLKQRRRIKQVEGGIGDLQTQYRYQFTRISGGAGDLVSSLRPNVYATVNSYERLKYQLHDSMGEAARNFDHSRDEIDHKVADINRYVDDEFDGIYDSIGTAEQSVYTIQKNLIKVEEDISNLHRGLSDKLDVVGTTYDQELSATVSTFSIQSQIASFETKEAHLTVLDNQESLVEKLSAIGGMVKDLKDLFDLKHYEHRYLSSLTESHMQDYYDKLRMALDPNHEEQNDTVFELESFFRTSDMIAILREFQVNFQDVTRLGSEQTHLIKFYAEMTRSPTRQSQKFLTTMFAQRYLALEEHLYSLAFYGVCKGYIHRNVEEFHQEMTGVLLFRATEYGRIIESSSDVFKAGIDGGHSVTVSENEVFLVPEVQQHCIGHRLPAQPIAGCGLSYDMDTGLMGVACIPLAVNGNNNTIDLSYISSPRIYYEHVAGSSYDEFLNNKKTAYINSQMHCIMMDYRKYKLTHNRAVPDQSCAYRQYKLKNVYFDRSWINVLDKSQEFICGVESFFAPHPQNLEETLGCLKILVCRVGVEEKFWHVSKTCKPLFNAVFYGHPLIASDINIGRFSQNPGRVQTKIVTPKSKSHHSLLVGIRFAIREPTDKASATHKSTLLLYTRTSTMTLDPLFHYSRLGPLVLTDEEANCVSADYVQQMKTTSSQPAVPVEAKKRAVFYGQLM